MASGKKSRILYIQKILTERTDENNPLSTNQIINILHEEYGISAHRTTIANDIEELKEFGLDVVTIHSTQSKYFVKNRLFNTAELKVLIDAVEASKVITTNKSNELVNKIQQLTSINQAAGLKRNNHNVNRVKPTNELIYSIINTINEAINTSKQIEFQYYEYTGLKKKILKNKGEVYRMSPYYMVWSGDFYYVLGYSDKHQKIVTFRVDRIAMCPKISNIESVALPDDFDIDEYTKSVFFMYDGEKVTVELRCDNSLMKYVIDRFGENVTTLAYDMYSFKVVVDVLASPTFFGWIFGFEGKIQILSPENVKEQYLKMISSQNNIRNI